MGLTTAAAMGLTTAAAPYQPLSLTREKRLRSAPVTIYSTGTSPHARSAQSPCHRQHLLRAYRYRSYFLDHAELKSTQT